MSDSNNTNISRREWIKTVASAAIAGAVTPALVSCSGRNTDDNADPADISWPDANRVIDRLPESIGCTFCENCMPCAYGVDIPGMFNIYNRALDNGYIPQSTVEFNSPDGLRRAGKFLRDAEQEIGDKHMAHRCIYCGHCLSRCPAKIKIIANLSSIGALIDLIRDRQCL